MPEDSIMDFVDNEESLYNRKLALFDRWMAQGDTWHKRLARIKAVDLGRILADNIREMGLILGQGRYKKDDIQKFADEMLSEFDEYREYEIKAIAERSRAAQNPTPMTQEDLQHAERCEGIAQRIGIDVLKRLVPASPEKIRKALETGDPYLNTIPLRYWDQAASAIPYVQGLSLSEKVCALKHVAQWHYA